MNSCEGETEREVRCSGVRERGGRQRGKMQWGKEGRETER